MKISLTFSCHLVYRESKYIKRKKEETNNIQTKSFASLTLTREVDTKTRPRTTDCARDKVKGRGKGGTWVLGRGSMRILLFVVVFDDEQ